jgi:phage tail sheath protein FI
MPEYLAPGVYVEEIEIGAKPIEGVGTSTAGFLGFSERGPTIKPMLVTSLTHYMRVYGGYINNSYLTYAVDGFFRNGGQRCYIGRIVRLDNEGNIIAKSAKLDGEPVTFTAVGEGSWGNRVAIRIEDASSGSEEFKLTVAYWSKNLPDADKFVIPANPEEQKRKLRELEESATKIEVFDNLSEDPDSPGYYMKQLGDPLKNLSYLVVLSKSGMDRPANTTGEFFDVLEEGSDAPDPVPVPDRGDFLGNPDAKPGKKRGLTAFNDIDEISIIYVPDAHEISNDDQRKALYDDILSHCENLKDRFAIIDTKENEPNIDTLKINSVARNSKYGAIYYPWIKVLDPLTEQMTFIPPGGHIAGIYARSDIERGVHKAPANEVVKGASELKFNITKGEQGILNPRGINVIRFFPGRGILVWGARTAILDPLWKYINVRRLFLFLEESIDEGTQWVVFEPNDEKLWARVRQTITQFLTRVWKDGALMGTTPEEAFFVKCDRTTMTQDDIDNGRLIVLIGVAPVKPAEFVIFRIAQWAGGSAATE